MLNQFSRDIFRYAPLKLPTLPPRTLQLVRSRLPATLYRVSFNQGSGWTNVNDTYGGVPPVSECKIAGGQPSELRISRCAAHNTAARADLLDLLIIRARLEIVHRLM